MSHTPYEPGNPDDPSDQATLPPELRNLDRSLSEDGRIWRNQLPSEEPVTRRVQTLSARGDDGNSGAGRGRPSTRATFTRVLAPVAAMALVVALLATGFYVLALNARYAKQPIAQNTATQATATATSAPQPVAHTIYFTGGATVYGLHASNGSVQWKRTFANASYLLGVDGSMLYAGSASDNGDGLIYGLDKTTGAVKWQLPGYVPGGATGGLFAAANGDVYMAVASRTSTTNTLYAVNGQTGVVLWQKPFPQPPAAPHATTPPVSMMTLIGKQLYIALDGSMQSEGAYVDDLDVYDATTGALRWRYAIPGEEFFSLLVENGEVYLSGTQAMYALDAQNGTVRWRSMYSPNTNNSGGTLIADGQAVLAATPYGLRLYDGASGAIRWTRNLQINNPGVLVAPNGLIYASTPIAPGGSPPQQIVAIDGTNGKQVWSFPYQSGLSLAGVSDNTLLIAAGPSPTAIIALSPHTGKQLWQHNLDSAAGQFTDVQINGSSIFCSTFSDQLFAFSAANGATEWRFTTSGSPINTLLID